VIPAGTPHQFTEIPDGISYVNIRFEFSGRTAATP